MEETVELSQPPPALLWLSCPPPSEKFRVEYIRRLELDAILAISRAPTAPVVRSAAAARNLASAAARSLAVDPLRGCRDEE